MSLAPNAVIWIEEWFENLQFVHNAGQRRKDRVSSDASTLSRLIFRELGRVKAVVSY
jgi:hypothetical protein